MSSQPGRQRNRFLVIGVALVVLVGGWFGVGQYNARNNEWKNEFRDAFRSTLPTLDRVETLLSGNPSFAEAAESAKQCREELASARSKILGLSLPDTGEARTYRETADAAYLAADKLVEFQQAVLKIGFRATVADSQMEQADQRMKAANEGISNSSYDMSQIYVGHFEEAKKDFEKAAKEKEATDEELMLLGEPGKQAVLEFQRLRAKANELLLP